MCFSSASSEIAGQGWSVLPQVFPVEVMAHWANRLRGDFESQPLEAIRERAGGVYAARNLLDVSPWIRDAWRKSTLPSFIAEMLGPDAGLVRGLFFDKPPSQSWALPWHKDMMISIRATDRVPDGYSEPRLRSGVWCTEPPPSVLQGMLTLRIHLDPMTEDNGPLEVLTGSHLTEKQLDTANFSAQKVLTGAGDVLAMRPLLIHCSGRSKEGMTQHRRVVHLEFAGQPRLADGIEWHQFERVG